MYFAFVIGVISAIASAWSWKRALVERAHEIDLPAGAARGCMKAAGWGMFVGALVVGGCVGLLGYAALISLADARSI